GEHPSGGTRGPSRANVSIIAATARHLRQLIRRGLFREDLFYRLNVVPIRLPPLRERVQDISDLVRHFLDVARTEGLGTKTLDRSGVERLLSYGWPGNVRELENLIRRLVVLNSAEGIDGSAVDAELATAAASPDAGPAASESLGAAAARRLRQYTAAH